ncbi:hypothetical protein RchiOBHm_Chr3g0492231 [Rosa chinensis]|uniref:Uncharacterized protein n=1 Tax=Rosa chinensis TaxID=74649 RepID=A0A2P6RGG5_ROSCH|nr:hypothetical protein RchiOBHm_Chr3g0492231 [Rosa chinensis]
MVYSLPKSPSLLSHQWLPGKTLSRYQALIRSRSFTPCSLCFSMSIWRCVLRIGSESKVS